VVSLCDSTTEPAQPKPEKGFAKFLAARRADWGGKGQAKDDAHDGSQPAIGEAVEVERDGYGEWKSIRMMDNGEGLGVADDAVHVSLLLSP